MAASKLSETDAGTYIDRDGDIVFVFTDKDMKNKSLVLQGVACQSFGRYTTANDGYYGDDYSPYLPVRLFLKNVKHSDKPSYDFEEIEQNEQYDGAWIGDQGTLIIHRSEGAPDRMLHVMFSYDTHNELKFVIYDFSPIFSRFRKEEKFRPIMEDELLTAVPVASKETNVVAQAVFLLANICGEIISKLEREREKVPAEPQLPDSNGFWRDKDGDIWAYDGNDDNPPIFLFDAESHRVTDICENPTQSWSDIEFYSPFTKIDNPFTTGNDNADL